MHVYKYMLFIVDGMDQFKRSERIQDYTCLLEHVVNCLRACMHEISGVEEHLGVHMSNSTGC